MDQKRHEACILTCLFVYTFLGSLTTIGTLSLISFKFNYISWFMVLFIVGSYIRKYPERRFFQDRLSFTKLIISLFLAILIIMLNFHGGETTSGKIYYYIADSNKILAFLISVYVFVTFAKLKINYHFIINGFAKTTLGILLIHANCAEVRTIVWKELSPNINFFGSKYIYIHAIGKVTIIFLVCAIIDLIRINTIEKVFMKLINRIIKKKD